MKNYYFFKKFLLDNLKKLEWYFIKASLKNIKF